MRHVAIAAIVSLTLASAAVTARAQTPPAAPQTTPQAAPQKPQAAPPPAVPFPEGAKVAFINPQRILSDSVLGKASSAKMNVLRTQKVNELNTKNKELETAQQKLAGGTLLSPEAGAATQKSIERLQVDIQRAQQDAEAALQELQQQLNLEFDRALAPIVAQIARDKGVQILLRIDAGAVAWADPALDLTGEIVRRLDAAKPASPVKPPAAL